MYYFIDSNTNRIPPQVGWAAENMRIVLLVRWMGNVTSGVVGGGFRRELGVLVKQAGAPSVVGQDPPYRWLAGSRPVRPDVRQSPALQWYSHSLGSSQWDAVDRSTSKLVPRIRQ